MAVPLRPVLLALPGLVLAAAGTVHPMHLSYATSQAWWTLHVPGLFVFPLVGVALMALFQGRRDPVALVAVLLAFGYAVAYSALDVIDGIAAGYVTHRLGPGVPRPDEVRYLFDIGRPFGEWGSQALLLATVVVVLDGLWRRHTRALPAVLMVPGAYLVHEFHIFAPQGVAGMVLIGLSTGWLAYVSQEPGPSRA
ncbi:MAG: hypothetical protein ABI776_19205 [Nocardioidaceae bacterium]